MVKLALLNQTPASKYREAIIDLSTGICRLDEQHDVEWKRVKLETDFSHPLLNHRIQQTADNVYHHCYDDVAGLFYSAIFVYSILLQVDAPLLCKFIIKPSKTFQWTKPQSELYFSINQHTPAKEAISVAQFERFVSYITRYRYKIRYDYKVDFNFEFLDDIFINTQLTFQDLPECVNGDLLYTENDQLISLLKNPSMLQCCEVRYINPVIGFGVFSREMIKNEDIICVYSGLKSKLPVDGTGYEFGSSSDALNMTISALEYGNISRFINHAPTYPMDETARGQDAPLNANVIAERKYLNGMEILVFATSRDILKGEQLLLNYGGKFFQNRNLYYFQSNGQLMGDKNVFRKAKREKLNEIRIIARQGVRCAQLYVFARLLPRMMVLSILVVILYKAG